MSSTALFFFNHFYLGPLFNASRIFVRQVLFVTIHYGNIPSHSGALPFSFEEEVHSIGRAFCVGAASRKGYNVLLYCIYSSSHSSSARDGLSDSRVGLQGRWWSFPSQIVVHNCEH